MAEHWAAKMADDSEQHSAERMVGPMGNHLAVQMVAKSVARMV